MRVEKDMVLQVTIDDFRRGDTEKCKMCEEGEATRSYAVQEFDYGSGKDAVTLNAHVPIWSCATCDLQYVDADGERAQHEAVCRHLGRLTPSEIKVIRISAKLTQKAFANTLQCGIASLKRWETGALIQGRAADTAIRQFQASAKRANPPKPLFRTLISDAQRTAAKSFSLRGTQELHLAA